MSWLFVEISPETDWEVDSGMDPHESSKISENSGGFGQNYYKENLKSPPDLREFPKIRADLHLGGLFHVPADSSGLGQNYYKEI